MKAAGVGAVALCLFVAIAAMTPALAEPSPSGIDYSADHRTVMFWCNDTDLMLITWSFGDGQTSYYVHPAHIYEQYGSYQIIAQGETYTGQTRVYTENITITAELLDEDTGTLNVGDLSVGGLFLLVSCSVGYWFAGEKDHPFAAKLGRRNLKFLYGLGILAGAYLTFTSIVAYYGVV